MGSRLIAIYQFFFREGGSVKQDSIHVGYAHMSIKTTVFYLRSCCRDINPKTEDVNFFLTLFWVYFLFWSFYGGLGGGKFGALLYVRKYSCLEEEFYLIEEGKKHYRFWNKCYTCTDN